MSLESLTKKFMYAIGLPALLIGGMTGKAKAQELDLSGSIHADIQNVYLATIGYPLFGNNVAQGNLELNFLKNTLKEGDSVWGFLWGNYGLEGDVAEESPQEVDFGAGYTVPELDEKIALSVNYEQFNYPDKVLSDTPDKILHTTLTYNGPLKVTLSDRKRVNDGVTSNQHLVELNLSEQLANTDYEDITITGGPELHLMYAHNFFGQEGFLGFRPGINIAVSKGNMTGNMFAQFYFKIGEHTLGDMEMQDQAHFGAGITYTWTSPE